MDERRIQREGRQDEGYTSSFTVGLSVPSLLLPLLVVHLSSFTPYSVHSHLILSVRPVREPEGPRLRRAHGTRREWE